MPTIVDSLIVTLGLDSKDVDAKAPGVRKKLADIEKEADKAKKTTDDFGKGLKQVSASLGSFLAVLGSTAAASVFIKNTIDTNTQLYLLSRNLEMNTQKLFAWGAAAQEIGGNKGTIQNFMRTIAGMPGELLIGRMPQLLPLFARLGINFREPFDQIMVDLSKRFSGMDRKVAFSFGMASGVPEDVMNLLLQGPGAVQSAIGRTAGFGPTGKEAGSALELKRRFTDLELLLVKIGYDLLYKVTPYLEKFLDVLMKIGEWAKRHERIVAIVAGLAAALAGVAGLAGALGAVTLAVTALWGAIAAAWPVLAVVGVVTALGAAILLLRNDYKVWSEGGKSLFNWGDWAEGIDTCSEAWDTLRDKIEKATNAFGKWVDRNTPPSGPEVGISLREKYDTFMAKHAMGWGIGKTTDQYREDFLVDLIASKEGFYEPTGIRPNIPQRAHNPGNIEYGDFAKSQGATGYVVAQGGKKIATFPEDNTGFNAMRVLVRSKGYSELSPDQAVSRWQTGLVSPRIGDLPGLMKIIHGIQGASSLPASVSSATTTSSTSNDNSRVTNIGTINMQNPAGIQDMTPTMLRGMDWTTLVCQQNFGL
jgi:hypothetical protein